MKLQQTLRVTVPGGDVIDAYVDARDFMAYDVARARRNWPPGSEAGFLLMQFLPWSALRRAEHPAAGAHFDVENPPFIDIEELEGKTPDPTPPVPGQG
jgi:hypothetical protein